MRRRLYVLPLFTLLISIGVGVWQPKVSAASNYAYTDTSYTAITGPFLDPSGKATKDTTFKSLASVNNPLMYAGDTGTGCTDYISVPSIGATSGKIDYACAPNTHKYQNISITVPGGGTGSQTGGTQTGTGTGGTGSSGSTTNSGSSNVSSPDINCGGLSLNWLICPLEEGLTTAVRGVDAAINDLLIVHTKPIFSNCAKNDTSGDCQTSAAYKAAWSSMRTLALALLVIAALAMIIAQATGSDLVDAYTIKKVLPRLIAAAIAITLSWQLLELFVTFTNDLGNGVRSLIYAPFSSLPQSISLGNAGGLAGLLAIGAGSILLGFGMLSFLATGLLAVLIAVLVLIVRQVLITFLIIIAPIALATYILPNTKKMYDLWWDFFAKALLMFPFIMAFIAAGRVFASVSAASAQSASEPLKTIEGLLAFVAYFAPYFLLPLTFRFAGGALGTIGGFVNDRGKGGFDRLRNYRANRMKDRYQRASSQSLWSKDTRFGRAGNALATWAVSPHSNAAYLARGKKIPIVSKSGRRIASQIEAARMEQSQKWFEHVNKHGANDKFFSATGGMYDDFSDATKENLVSAGLATWKTGRDGQRRIVADRALTTEADFNKMADVLQGSDSDSEQKAALALRANAAYTANMYRDAEMTKADVATGAALGRAVHGFLAPQDSADSENLLTKMYGAEYAHAATVNAQAIASRTNPDNKPGYGTQYDRATGEWVTAHEGSRGWAVLPTLKPSDYVEAKGNMLKDNRLGGEITDAIALNNGGTQAQAVVDRWEAQGVSEQEIESRVNIANSQREVIRDTLFNIAGPYSQVSGDSKARALELIERGGYGPAFSQYKQATTDPTLRGQSGLPQQPPQQPGQPGAGPTPGSPLGL